MSMDRRQFSRRLGGAALGLLAWPGRAAATPPGDPQPEPIRVALVGTGHSHARGKLESLARLAERYDVVGIAEPDPELRADLPTARVFRGYPLRAEERLMDDDGLEAVVIETAERDLVATAERWIAAGRHVHLEKPAGESLPAFERLAAEARRRGRALQLGYMFRHHPAFELAFRAAREGWLGDVYELHGVIGKVIDAERRREWAAFPGGTMYVLGCHLIDAAVAVLGRPDSVEAHVKRTRPEQDALADNQLAVLTYPEALATIRSAAIDVEGFARRELAIHGDRGAVTIRPLEPARVTLTLTEPTAGHAAGTHEVELPPPAGRYDGQLLELARVVRGEKAPDYPLEHELAVQETLLRACAMPLS